MRKVNTIVLASNNRHKLEEFRSLFKEVPDIQIAAASDFIHNADKLGMVEVHDTYEGNALAKARACNHACHYPSLSDDSGLEAVGLDYQPGVKSHRYATPMAGKTQDEANIIKLIQSLESKPGASREARFVCHLALVMEGIALHSVGILEGTLAPKVSGTGGFGYDPVFIPHGYDKTLSELGPDVKNKISHRAVAVKNLLAEMVRHGIVLAKP